MLWLLVFLANIFINNPKTNIGCKAMKDINSYLKCFEINKAVKLDSSPDCSPYHSTETYCCEYCCYKTAVIKILTCYEPSKYKHIHTHLSVGWNKHLYAMHVMHCMTENLQGTPLTGNWTRRCVTKNISLSFSVVTYVFFKECLGG